MKVLGLDVGRRKTGVAFYDDDIGIVFPVGVIDHGGIAVLTQSVLALMTERHVHYCVLGFPLLPSGVEGSQASFVRRFAARLQRSGVRIFLFDERYTTDADHNDSSSACHILMSFVDKKSKFL